MSEADIIDARGLLCPLPVLRLRKALMDLAPGQQVTLLATDAMAMVDVPHFCEQAGHAMITAHEIDDGVHEYVVVKGT